MLCVPVDVLRIFKRTNSIGKTFVIQLLHARTCEINPTIPDLTLVRLQDLTILECLQNIYTTFLCLVIAICEKLKIIFTVKPSHL